MFNIGFSEFLVIGIIALLVIGPKQLPEVARVVGKLLSELKNATQELSGGLLDVTRDVKSSIDETKSKIVNEGRKIVEDATRIDSKPKEAEPKFENLEGKPLEEDHPYTDLEKAHASPNEIDNEKVDKEIVDAKKE